MLQHRRHAWLLHACCFFAQGLAPAGGVLAGQSVTSVRCAGCRLLRRRMLWLLLLLCWRLLLQTGLLLVLLLL